MNDSFTIQGKVKYVWETASSVWNTEEQIYSLLPTHVNCQPYHSFITCIEPVISGKCNNLHTGLFQSFWPSFDKQIKSCLDSKPGRL